jgi:hypothetical protein
LIEVFRYSSTPHGRRHGPAGYSSYKRFKPWLRDDFTFRCIYCLFREKWYPDGAAAFGVDHHIPQSKAPSLALVYDNLFYTCQRCNSLKQDHEFFVNPSVEAIGSHMHVLPTGEVEALTKYGNILIDFLQLNDEERVRWRQHLLRLANAVNAGMIEPQQLADEIAAQFKFPDNLPDLRALHPPNNSLPAGAESCYYVQRENGVLPSDY